MAKTKNRLKAKKSWQILEAKARLKISKPVEFSRKIRSEWDKE